MQSENSVQFCAGLGQRDEGTAGPGLKGLMPKVEAEAATPKWDAVPRFRPQGCRVERSHSHGGKDQERLHRGGSARDEHRAGPDRQKALQEEGGKRAKAQGWEGLGHAPDTVGKSEGLGGDFT